MTSTCCASPEVWAWIAGYRDYYLISSRGRIISLKCNGSPVELKIKINVTHGYAEVSLQRDKNVSYHRLHRLILLSFRGTPVDDATGSHLDGKKEHNCLTNLTWETLRENLQRKWEHGTMPHGATHHNSKLDKEKVIRIFQEHRNGETGGEIARRYNVSRATIRALLQRKTWKHIEIPSTVGEPILGRLKRA